MFGFAQSPQLLLKFPSSMVGFDRSYWLYSFRDSYKASSSLVFDVLFSSLSSSLKRVEFQ